MSGDAIFYVYHSGTWMNDSGGESGYIGGEVKTIECALEAFHASLCSEFGDSVFEKKLWYTYPYEEPKDRKELGIMDNSLEKMYEGARWVRVVNIFVCDAEVNGESEGGFVDIEVNQDFEAEPCAEEIRVEQCIAPFAEQDEDPEFDYHDTPPNSDGEYDDREQYVRFKRGSGELKLKQVFESLEDFKEALIEYALKGGWNIKQSGWGDKKCAAICGSKDYVIPCKWRVYCSYEEPVGKYMIKTFEDTHSCIKDGYCKLLKSRVLASMFLDDIRADPELKPKIIQDNIQKTYNIIVSPDKCSKAKQKALDIIQKEYEEQFYRLRDYRTELIHSNPGSSVELDTVLNDKREEVFRRFYVCFANIKRQWTTWCRRIFGLDGCFLKSTLKGQLLAAIGRDANNGMYPIAWAVVDIEDEENWKWFIKRLKIDLENLGDGQGYTVISDRQKGLLNAVDMELPKVEHRMCARHIYGNLKKMFPRQSELKGMFWRVAESYTINEYEAALERVKAYDLSVYRAIMQKNPQNCSLVFCSPSACCVDVHNNIAESFNNAINPSRYLPMVEMLETIRRRAMQRIELRMKKALSHQGRFTPRAAKMIAEEQDKLKFVKYVAGSSDGRCEVLDCGKSVSLHMGMRTCACRRWEMSGIPCRHALTIIATKNLNHDDYTSEMYSNSKQQQIYSSSIEPVNGMKFWRKSGTIIKPPPSLVEEIQKKKGRKPKPKRMKPRHESPTKKVSRRMRSMHCSRCSIAGHNIKGCKNVGVVRPKKKSDRIVDDDDEDEE